MACALASGLTGGLASSPIHADEPAPPRDELATVTVVGITPYGTAEQRADELAGAAQTADADDLARSHATDLGTFLNRRLGSVYVNENQGNPLQPDVNFRGFTASPLLGTAQGLSVYLDGMRLNQPFGDVVSWDLIPRAAIQRMELVSGSSPLFGVNSLGGALSLHTKDGFTAPSTDIAISDGSHDRRQVEIETGGNTDSGLNWYATANRFRDAGWRNLSPSDAKQGFAKLGWRDGRTDISLSAAVAQSDLSGNGLQDFRLLARDYASVYTTPDSTQNRSGLVNLRASFQLGQGMSLSGNVWYRNLRTATLNGDVNESALGTELTAPMTGDCLASVQRRDAPNEACAGLVNRTGLSQHNAGLALQFHAEGRVAGFAHRLTTGFVLDESRAHFTQTAQFATLTLSRDVVGVSGPGAYADGTQTSADAFDARVDLGGRTRTQSLYLVDSVALTDRLRANLAARYDQQRSLNRDALSPGGGPGSLDGDHRYSRLDPALGLVLTTAPSFALYGSYSEASRAPSSIELGCADPANPCRLPNAMAGDPPLDQVVTKSLELGARGKAGSALDWSMALFRADNHDDILFVADNQAGFGYFRNVDKTRRQGLELGLDGHAGTLAYGAHFTLLDATYQSAETLVANANSSSAAPAPGFDGTITVAPGDRIPLVPGRILKAYAEWALAPRVSLNVNIGVIGASYARGNENNRHTPDGLYYLGRGSIGGYATVDLGAEWRPAATVTLWLQVANLLDRRYATAAQLGTTAFDGNGSFVARPFSMPVIDGELPQLHSTLLAPGAPRSIVVGIRYRLAGA
jgi:outer membrane receptor protein involved in Fe transport